MKKHILTSSLLLSLSTATVASICSCAPTSVKQETKVEQVETDSNHNEDKPAEKERLSSAYAAVKFVDGGQTGITFIGATTSKATIGKPFATVRQPMAMNSAGYYSDYWEYAEDVQGTTHKQGDKVQNWDIITTNISVRPYFSNEVDVGSCVGIAAINDSTVSLVNHGGNRPSVDFSTDGIHWDTYAGQSINVPSGETLYFKGSNSGGFSHSETQYTSFQIGGAVNLNGKVMSLIDNGIAEEKDIVEPYCFYSLFSGCSGVVSISSEFFPYGALSAHCYEYLFKDCTSLTDFPSTLLPVEELKGTSESGVEYDAEKCYAGMFMGCTGLATLPVGLLPATTLSNYCYRGMFIGCTGLNTIPAGLLPASTLTEGCYYGMFSECNGLVDNTDDKGIDEDLLASAETLAPMCYCGMFSSCLNLKSVPSNLLPIRDLSAKSGDVWLYTGCYSQMFYGCTSLATAPTLPAGIDEGTGICPYCYQMMFYNCEALKNQADGGAPALPAKTMQSYCYSYMFYNCSTLTTIPTISATTLATYCFAEMFRACENLGNLGTVALSITTAADHCYYRMFADCTKMTATPTIGLTTMAANCCEEMFMNCEGITASPALGATTAADSCYYNMFNGCSKLETIGYISIGTNGWRNSCCSYMFSNCTTLYAYTDGVEGNRFMYIPTYSVSFTETYILRMFQYTGNFPTSGGYVQMPSGYYCHHTTL